MSISVVDVMFISDSESWGKHIQNYQEQKKFMKFLPTYALSEISNVLYKSYWCWKYLQ